MNYTPWVNVPNYLPIFNLCLSMIVIGKNIEGSRLPMVFLISAIILVQSASVLILTSYFLCNPYWNGPAEDPDYPLFPAYNFW